MIWLKKIIANVFGKGKQKPVLLLRPTREEINRLPFFDALRLGSIVEVDSPESAAEAFAALSRESVLGFDTESKPTFAKGEVSSGPHVAQFATPKRTYVVLLHDEVCRRVARDLISSSKILKVGFGLDGDRRLIPIRLKVRPRAFLDLETLFARRGYGRNMGVKSGVAIVFKRRFSKPRSVSTSNWARRPLSPSQLLYAANDAYAALCVYNALQNETSL